MLHDFNLTVKIIAIKLMDITLVYMNGWIRNNVLHDLWEVHWFGLFRKHCLSAIHKYCVSLADLSSMFWRFCLLSVSKTASNAIQTTLQMKLLQGVTYCRFYAKDFNYHHLARFLIEVIIRETEKQEFHYFSARL